jgi:hypothetical protein
MVTRIDARSPGAHVSGLCPKSGRLSEIRPALGQVDKSTSRAGLAFGHAEPQIPSSTGVGVFGLLGSVRTPEFKALSGAIE